MTPVLASGLIVVGLQLMMASAAETIWPGPYGQSDDESGGAAEVFILLRVESGKVPTK